MSLKIPVKDRVALYPGRVTLTPVVGQNNTYDMIRADSPTEVGTPINKALLDQKAYALAEDVTLYVATTGSDTDGDGSQSKPYATIQKAIDELPKWFQGHDVTILVASGVYAERLEVRGFHGGTLTLTEFGGEVTISGIIVINTRMLYFDLTNIVYSESTGNYPLFRVINDSCVYTMMGAPTLDCQNCRTGFQVDGCSKVYLAGLVVNNAHPYAVNVNLGGELTVDYVGGTNNNYGLRCTTGGLIRYDVHALESENGDRGAVSYGY